MVLPALLSRERIVRISELRRHPETLKGFVRVVAEDNGGLKTCGFFLDKEGFSELLESLEYSSPNFWKEIEASRKSGRVSAKKIEKRLGLK